MWFDLRKEGGDFVVVAPVVQAAVAEVAAPRASVFTVLADPRTWPAWFPGVRSATYASPPPYGVGTIREAHVGSTHWVEEIIAWDHDARWAYTVVRSTVPFARAQVESFELTDSARGTRVRWTLALEPRLLARLGAPFAPRVITHLFDRAMKNLDAYLRDGATR